MNITGCLLINKPKNITSFQCVRQIKKILTSDKTIPANIKIGHTGTLDPFATGLLIICIGRETTKSITSLLNLDKEYIVTAKLGLITDTLDYTGTIIETSNISNITKQDIKQAMQSLGASYLQIPPIYSALKYQGAPLYKLARQKKIDPEILEAITKKKSHKVELYSLDLLEYSPPYFTFKAHVSKGTYIRSLANDIAQKLDSYATIYELERTKIGTIPLAKAVALDTIKSVDDIKEHLITKENFS